MDPKYGTLVFVTVDGQSKCPNEGKCSPLFDIFYLYIIISHHLCFLTAGTRPIEDPLIKIVEATRPSIVPNDELMVFDVEISNQGFGESTFYLLSDKLENAGN